VKIGKVCNETIVAVRVLIMLHIVASLAKSGGLFSRADPREGGPALDIERGTLLAITHSFVIKIRVSSWAFSKFHSNEQAREGRYAIYYQKRPSDRPCF
jgi:hypothetical protein